MDGNHKITKAEVYGTTDDEKCPECGSKMVEDCVVCDADMGLCECTENNRKIGECEGDGKNCPERKPGGKCLSCGHTWRD